MFIWLSQECARTMLLIFGEKQDPTELKKTSQILKGKQYLNKVFGH